MSRCFLAGILCVLGACGCSGKSPSFGTLPRIEVPIEKKPRVETPPARKKDTKPPPRVDALPDPAPQRRKEQIELRLRFEDGSLHVISSRAVVHQQPVVTPRRIGRFAAELWLGGELLERLRFEVPLLGADGGESLERGLVTELTISLPALERANRLQLVDRKTDTATVLDWPPAAPVPPQPEAAELPAEGTSPAAAAAPSE